MIEGAGRAGDQARGDMCIARRRRQVGMAEQRLNDANVDASLQEMGGETVPQRMRGDGLVDPGLLSRPAASVLQGAVLT